jgi:ABC-type uncharacterized transport system permease subunit
MADLLVWAALIAYGTAAIAYVGDLRGPGVAGRVATWGVRLGWIAQTALLAVQLLDADGFPWGTWAGALNLLSWLVVAGYLVWGCRPRYRLVGLAVMPLAAGLVVLAWLGGGTGVDNGDRAGVLLGVHVGLMLAGFAGLTLATGMAALYVWEERRLKRHDRTLLRLRVPPLDTLDRLSARAALVALGLLAGGIVAGLASFESGDFDAAMAVTLAVWAIYALLLVLRHESRVLGGRAARMTVAAFALVALVLPITHFAS